MRYIQPSCRALRLDDVLLVRWTHWSGEALDRRMCAKVDLGPTGVPITAMARPECAVHPSLPTIHRIVDAKQAELGRLADVDSRGPDVLNKRRHAAHVLPMRTA